ncbi:MipA/OmpV family protein [Thalassotalea euphylliae]|uniref:MipA/OmpV family protein n=1 Tax=Thalassotalea euphylliae TaxID=1655234 RepID=A0A3E0UIW8_9GAMM|nr:MipA/OmpV family protein [Thalassotalea euphylliae]REL36816.1 MipA/OmpV family protein [Thalassotalea euphylliae]
MKVTLRDLGLIIVLSVASTTSYANLGEVPDIDTAKGSGLKGMLGLGAMSVPEYIGGNENETEVLPIINLTYQDKFYFRFNRGGWWFWQPQNSHLNAGLEVGFRRGWEREDLVTSLSDSLDLSGPQFNETDDAILAGVNVEYSNNGFSTEVSLLTASADENFYGEDPGIELILRASYTMVFSPKFSLSTSSKIEVLSKDTVNYYYGVNGYEGDLALNVSLAAIGAYRVTDNWLVLGSLGVNFLGSEIADSPLVADDSQSIAILGAAYSF